MAVGEIGLDFHYNFSDKKEQITIYQEQLELATSVNLPAVVHCRGSDNEILNGILESKNAYGVIHCFASTLAFSQQILKTGFEKADFDMVLQNAEGVKKQIYFDNPEVANNNAILDELETFADAINTNTKPIVTLHDGTEALRVATMIIDQF